MSVHDVAAFPSSLVSTRGLFSVMLRFKRLRSLLVAVLILLVIVQGVIVMILISHSGISTIYSRYTKQTLRRAWHDVENASVSQFAHVSAPKEGAINITLYVAVLTHPSRSDRRDSIRETWMKRCEERRRQVMCRFFTDGAGLDNETELSLLDENEGNQDMEFLPIAGNYLFAERLLWILSWVSIRFNYDFFLRIDDDHFLCLDHLLHDLNFRPKTALYWGFFHCKRKIVRADEAWLVLSADLVREILTKRNSTLLCHPFGDQAVAMWINNSTKNVTYFMDNERIVHKSAGRDQRFLTSDVCERFVSLHGAYPTSMRRFWLISYKLRKRSGQELLYRTPVIPPFHQRCKHSPVFDYTGFILKFRFKPRPCYQKPRWRLISQRHGGREEDGEMYSSY